MIYITGDTHGNYDKFAVKNFAEQVLMTKDDYVIICGDFGFWKDNSNQKYWLNWLD